LSTLESDGLLGLSPKTNRLTDDNIEVHLLINELKKDGIIDKALFSMYLTDYRKKSKIYRKKSKMHFGGWDETILAESVKENKKLGVDTSKSDNGISWMDINSEIHW